jgi:hypothetical protein
MLVRLRVRVLRLPRERRDRAGPAHHREEGERAVSDGFTMCVACYGVNGEHKYSNCVYAPPPDPLATLRAEVERLRNQAARAAEPDDDDMLDEDALVEKYAYGRVLDLIDKHARESTPTIDYTHTTDPRGWAGQ